MTSVITHVRLANDKESDSVIATVYTYDIRTQVGNEFIGSLIVKNNIVVNGRYTRGTEQTLDDLQHFTTATGSGYNGRIRSLPAYRGRNLFENWYRTIEGKDIRSVKCS